MGNRVTLRWLLVYLVTGALAAGGTWRLLMPGAPWVLVVYVAACGVLVNALFVGLLVLSDWRDGVFSKMQEAKQ